MSLTVCITHVMREKLLRDCLNSLYRNAGYPFKAILMCVGKKKPVIHHSEITVLHQEGQGLGASRRMFSEVVDTPYLMFLDNDVMTYPDAVRRLMEIMKRHPELGILTSLIKLDKKVMRDRYIANIMIEDGKTWKKFTSFDEAVKSGKKLWYSDFTGFDHTLFRTEALREIEYDAEYPIGYEHWDACLQFKLHTGWKLATLTEELFEHVTRFNTPEYDAVRYNKGRLARSRRHFVEKWRLEPVNPPW